MGASAMKRNVRFATMVAHSILLFASFSRSGAYQPGPLTSPEASENLCRADQMQSALASYVPPAEPPSDRPARERVFVAPLRGVLDKGVIDAARNLVDSPMGTEVIIEVNGTPYGFRLEPHYHPPGYEGGPIGWHKGVTV